MKWIAFWVAMTVASMFVLSYAIGAGSVVAICFAGLWGMLSVSAFVANLALYMIVGNGRKYHDSI